MKAEAVFTTSPLVRQSEALGRAAERRPARHDRSARGCPLIHQMGDVSAGQVSMLGTMKLLVDDVSGPNAAGFALPTGTVTFLLTDVEGSTRRWEDAPELDVDGGSSALRDPRRGGR